MEILKKGIAINTLIILVLALIVLGLVGYLIFKHYVKADCEINSAGCLAARIKCCCAHGTLAETLEACKHCGPAEVASCDDMPCPGPCKSSSSSESSEE